uniref:Uncharacterized protein n=1 Tax=Rhizophora mucronata TaxID=61149 RepID=A0A2P2J3P3_RHIMU
MRRNKGGIVPIGAPS